MYNNYQGKKIVIVGLGYSGMSCLRYFLRKKITPRVVDSRLQPPLLKHLPQGIEYHLGELRSDWLLQADLIILSPGIALVTPIIQQAISLGIEVVGDIELFCREITQPLVAITGSNGKSTVTALLAKMAHNANLSVGVGGNIGTPALDLLVEPKKFYILELSSFQLETTYSMSAAASAILNISMDHQDRYPQGISTYIQAKQRIYHRASCCVFNADDKLTHPSALTPGNHYSFGSTQADFHLIKDCDTTWLSYRNTMLLSSKQLGWQAGHHQQNALAALALAQTVGIAQKYSLEALKNFSGLPHRFQLILQRRGVRWINDSKATNVGSTVAALTCLPKHARLHLLLGGDSKGADFSPLVPLAARETIHIYCFGRSGPQLASLWPSRAVCTTTLAQAMQKIATLVDTDDLVLLSPACASFDQFSNFEQRGLFFTRLAKELG